MCREFVVKFLKLHKGNRGRCSTSPEWDSKTSIGVLHDIVYGSKKDIKVAQVRETVLKTIEVREELKMLWWTTYTYQSILGIKISKYEEEKTVVG